MSESKSLKCSTCGISPTPFLEAKAGGTHYRIVEHGVGIPGRKPTRNARKCGTWQYVTPPAQGMYPPGWPKCACGDYALDGKATCGRVECLRG